MGTIKRSYPLAVWLWVFLFLVLLYLPGWTPFFAEGLQGANMSGVVRILQDRPADVQASLSIAFSAALLCLAAGLPAGCLLGILKQKALLAVWLIPILSLAGMVLFYARGLTSPFPAWMTTVFRAAAVCGVPAFASLAATLSPLMLLCVSSAAASKDPALSIAARGFGASRLKAYLTFTFPGALAGAIVGFLAVFVSSAALSFLTIPGLLPDSGRIIGGASIAFTAVLLAACMIKAKKAGRLSPC